MTLGKYERIVLEILDQKDDWVSQDDIAQAVKGQMKRHDAIVSLIRLTDGRLVEMEHASGCKPKYRTSGARVRTLRYHITRDGRLQLQDALLSLP